MGKNLVITLLFCISNFFTKILFMYIRVEMKSMEMNIKNEKRKTKKPEQYNVCIDFTSL